MGDKSVSRDEKYYEGWKGTLRILAEAFGELPGLLRGDVKNIASKLRGKGNTDGESCGLGSCGRRSVSMYEWRERYREDTPICRRHWLMLVGAKAIVAFVIYGTLATVFIFSLWLVMTG